MRPRLIEVYEIDTIDNAGKIQTGSIILVRAQDVLALRTFCGPTNSKGHSATQTVIYLNKLNKGMLNSSYDEHFPTRLSYASEADRAFDDPIAFPSAAIAAAMQGTHSLGLGLAQVEAIAQSLLLPEHFELAKRNAEMRAIHQAKAKDAPFAEFIAQSAARAAQQPPAIDFSSKNRSRSAYPEKGDAPLAPNAGAPKPSPT